VAPARRSLIGSATVVLAACASVGLLLGQFWLMSHLSWTHRESPRAALVGFNFSCDQAEYLLLEDPALGPAGYVSDERAGRAEWCAGILDELLEATGARTVRLSLQWDEIERSPGVFDFAVPDALIAAAGRDNATVSLTVGMKAQRHPEFYLPPWVQALGSPGDGAAISAIEPIRAAALTFVSVAVQHYLDSEVIDSWGAENEPYIASHRSDDWSLDAGYIEQVVQTIQALDARHRPVVVNHAQHFVMDRRWKLALSGGDILGQSMYPFRNLTLFGTDFQADIMQLGPLMPNYAFQARESARAGKYFWITELQAEPWTDADSRLITPESPSDNLDPARLRKNVDYAQRTSAQRIYLWGAEWWLYEQRLGDNRWLESARQAIYEAAVIR
jgi:hypothetical protein